MTFEPQDPQYRARVEEIFDRAAFVNHLGIALDDLGPGWCTVRLDVRPEHLQQTGFVHAGVLATVADHAAGAAASTLLPADRLALSVEFKVNFLRPAVGERLVCRAEVLKGGRTISVADSRVEVVRGGEWRLVAQATVTLSSVARERVSLVETPA